MITIKQYEKSLKKVNEIKEAINKNHERVSMQRRKIEKEADDKIFEINQNRFKQIDLITKEAVSFKEEKDIELKPFEDDLIAYYRILNVLRIYINKKNYTLPEVEVYDYDYPKDEKGEVIRVNGYYPEKEKIYYKPIGIIAQDDFKDIKVYVVNNDDYRKKVNKFGLWIVGVSIFNDMLIKLPYTYGGDLITSNDTIKKLLKEAPTREELVKWFEKNKDKIFKKELEDINKVQEEYNETIKLWEDKEWKIAFYENEKNYYENDVHKGIESEKYKQVLKELKKIK